MGADDVEAARARANRQCRRLAASGGIKRRSRATDSVSKRSLKWDIAALRTAYMDEVRSRGGDEVADS